MSSTPSIAPTGEAYARNLRHEGSRHSDKEIRPNFGALTSPLTKLSHRIDIAPSLFAFSDRVLFCRFSLTAVTPHTTSTSYSLSSLLFTVQFIPPL